jgi:hypothetical protein
VPLVPQPANRHVGIIDYPPAIGATVVVPQTVFPTSGPPDEPVRVAEVFFAGPDGGQLFLLDALTVSSNSPSVPTCYVGLIPAAQKSLFIPAPSRRPYGEPDWPCVFDWSPNGGQDTADLGGIALHAGEVLSVLWVGVTAPLPAGTTATAVIVRCFARLHYRLAAVA